MLRAVTLTYQRPGFDVCKRLPYASIASGKITRHMVLVFWPTHAYRYSVVPTVLCTELDDVGVFRPERG